MRVWSLEVGAGHRARVGDRGQPGAAFPPPFSKEEGIVPGREQQCSVLAGSLSSTRLAPIYFSTGVLWILIAASALGILHFFLSHYVGLNILRLLTA